MSADALRGRGHLTDALPLLGTAAVWGGFLGVSAAEPLELRCRGAKSAVAAEQTSSPSRDGGGVRAI